MQTLIILHGAVGSRSQFSELEVQLAGKYITHALNFSGHDGLPVKENFSISGFAEEVLEFIVSLQLEEGRRVNLFGYSMGGYVAMYLAKHYPENIRAVCTLATKFYWDKDVAEKESGMLNAEKIEAKLPAFAKTLEERHAPNDWKLILKLTRNMLRDLGSKNVLDLDDYKEIVLPVLLMIGDRDKMVTIEETLDVYRALPTANLSVLPGTPHPIEQADLKLLINQLDHFLLNPGFGD